ncbi:DUF2254 domain-containing protein [Flavobacterium faecale]|uniref:DUF2254 domain-containing protein n=1 Tax=Flavobacterium faecale TaxID=1355330 RepID=UPI003AB01A35
MKKNIRIYILKIREKLWFRPLLFCVFSVIGALFAHQADGFGFNENIPDISIDSIKALLDTISSSMLVISIFAVGSMISAFSNASTTATPRSFKIVVTDDVSQNALSVFIGAFIFSIVATIALNNEYYGKAGRFILFLFTILLFTVVILTFLRWVDRISRLGRLEHTINQIETVAAKSLTEYISHPNLKALPIRGDFPDSLAITANSVGYVQHINMEELQAIAKDLDLKMRLNCIPGKFVHDHFVIAYVRSDQNLELEMIAKKINNTIHVGTTRIFDEDPRFGLIALSEIASRALSPGINDPGTAIQIIGSHERLFFLWNQEKKSKTEKEEVLYDRVEVQDISMEDFFDDAFRPISRDGADNIEVMLRLQKTYTSLGTIDNDAIKKSATQFAKEAFNRAKLAMQFENDLENLKEHCLFSK